MQITPRYSVPFAAALLAGALTAYPSFAQSSNGGPSAKAAAKTDSPSGMYAGVKIAHGPGVIPNDAPKGPAGLVANSQASISATTSSTSGPSAKAAAKTEYPNDMYAGAKVAHGPGVIPNDAPKTSADVAASSTAASYGYRRRDAYDGYQNAGFGFYAGFGPDFYADEPYAYEPYGYEDDYGARCFERRVRFHHHWEWRRVCR
jgi:hypothetical protein